jgi:RNA polymerase sigma-70 factor (ECF subfamily)
LLAREKVQMIQVALKKLSPRQKSVFVMRFAEEMDLGEIAEATGMPVTTVKTHLYRAVAEIRSKFGASL